MPRCNSHMNSVARKLPVLAGFIVWAALSAGAQYTTIYNFGDAFSGDGSDPYSTPIADSSGNLYGTTVNLGGVYKLTPAGNSMWTESFYGGMTSINGSYPNGASPYGRLLLDPKRGNLYGTTVAGGSADCGVVYQLTPPSEPNGDWAETVLYSFTCGADGSTPYSDLISDGEGRLYGTTLLGGQRNNGHFVPFGVVFMLTPPSQSGGSWTEQVLHTFQGGSDGGNPFRGLVMDSSGAVYGTTDYNFGYLGKNLYGTVFKLTPPANGQSGWTETVLHRFTGGADGKSPIASLVLDSTGALYGTTPYGGSGCPPRVSTGCGVVFQLVPPASNGGDWTENVIYAFTGQLDGAKPGGRVVFDSAGALYGTTDGAGKTFRGTIFKLSPPSGGTGPWTITSVPFPKASFGGSTGVLLLGNHIYGATSQGGTNGTGSVFELSQ
jgi:uncharacterized repeat protein (TIGR03803 family)